MYQLHSEYIKQDSPFTKKRWSCSYWK